MFAASHRFAQQVRLRGLVIHVKVEAPSSDLGMPRTQRNNGPWSEEFEGIVSTDPPNSNPNKRAGTGGSNNKAYHCTPRDLVDDCMHFSPHSNITQYLGCIPLPGTVVDGEEGEEEDDDGTVRPQAFFKKS